MLTAYLANPLGFSDFTKQGIQLIHKVLSKYFTIIEPFAYSASLGKRIYEIQQKLLNETQQTQFLTAKQELAHINQEIGKKNADSIRSADIIFAILDGSDVDSGVAAEIGFSYGLGKPIFGIRTDLRISGDNYGCEVNLQVQYFIEKSGGAIFGSLDEMKDTLINQFQNIN